MWLAKEQIHGFSQLIDFIRNYRAFSLLTLAIATILSIFKPACSGLHESDLVNGIGHQVCSGPPRDTLIDIFTEIAIAAGAVLVEQKLVVLWLVCRACIV